VSATRLMSMVACVFGIAWGILFIVVGVNDGLVARRMLSNAGRGQYATGRAAIGRGILYVAVGVVFVGVLTWALVEGLGSR
jgi:hypothetical protein